MKVERVSYPAPTPSAARGILEAIFWKPEFRWEVVETRLLKPIHYASLLRNEVKDKIAFSTVSRWAEADGHYVAAEGRTQRHTLALADVDYVIVARMVLGDTAAHPAKYRDQFRRRVARGQCYHRPYLGCREFAAHFGPASGDEPTIPDTMELGLTLWDLDYREAGRSVPLFFEARMAQGVVRYPTVEEVGLCSSKGS
jgi:CRISPR-associated protein Cas5d